MSLLFLDTETTGFTHNRLVQLAWEHHPTGERVVQHFQPPVPIEDGAAKVHGKTTERASQWPRFAGSLAEQQTLDLVARSVLVAHNAEYDMKVLANEGIPVNRWICTMKVARKLLPTEANHKLQSLKTSVGFTVPDEDLTAHDALGDVMTMIGLFAYMWSIEEGRGLTENEIIQKWIGFSSDVPDTMPFGKHRGVPIKDLPESYVRWVLQEDKFDEGVLKAIKLHLPHLA